MKTRLFPLSIIATLAALITSCGSKEDTTPDDGNTTAAPTLVSSTPANGATDITGTTLSVVITMDQNVYCPSAKKSEITAGDATVSKIIANGTTITVTLTGLEEGSGKTYTLSFPEGTISGYSSNIAAAISISFTMYKAVEYNMNPASSLTNSNATAKTKALYEYLLSQYGKKTISGAMGGTAWTTAFTDEVYTYAGEYPAIVGFDYLFVHWGDTNWDPDYDDISVIKNAHDAGNIIQIGWHWNVPSSKGAANDTWGFYAPGKHNGSTTTFDIENALTDGTWEHEVLDALIDSVGTKLKLLQDADIPVLFRPLHEAAGDYTWGAWFWWGTKGATPCVNLWKYLRDKLENTYGLNNLIWVWTAQTSSAGKKADVSYLKEWYPGNDYVDIVGADLYVEGGTSQSDIFKLVNNSVEGKKMVTLSECGSLLGPDKYFEEGAPWLYFLGWEDIGLNSGWNTAATWRAGLTNSYVLNRDDMPSTI